MATERQVSSPPAARVLIVDDSPGVSDVLAIKLKREGFAVAVAPSAEGARQLLEADEFDIVLLDVQLPDGTGIGVLTQLRQQRSALETPVIMVSGLDRSSDVVAALKLGANDYIAKPFDLSVVLARIHTQLALKRLQLENDRFLRIASHDLKKPLLVMLDGLRQLRAEAPASATSAEDHTAVLTLLIDSGEYMQEIISELLELRALRDRRLQIAKLPTDFGAIVRQAVARNAAHAARRNCRLVMEFARDLPNIRADDARVMQVLENLIGNAIKFGPPENVVTIRAHGDGGNIVCEVIDAGPGIAEHEQALLFKEYARLSNLPTGGEKSTGLGLSICRELILLHGGEIGYRNNPGGGATFWFRLPIS